MGVAGRDSAGGSRPALTAIVPPPGPRTDGILEQTNSHQPPVDLTPREASILRLLSLGKKTADISEELHVSAAAVRDHFQHSVQHSLEKLRAHTRLEAMIRASRMRLT